MASEEAFRLEQDDRTYIVSSGISRNKLYYTCQCENDPNDTDVYSTELSLDDFDRMKDFFKVFSDIYEVRDNINQALSPEDPQIGIEKSGKEISLVFYTMCGTDDDFLKIKLYPQAPVQVSYQPVTKSTVPEYNPISNDDLEKQVKQLVLRNSQLEKEIDDLRKLNERNSRLDGERQKQLELHHRELERQKKLEEAKQKELQKQREILQRQSQLYQKPTQTTTKNDYKGPISSGTIPLTKSSETQVVQGEIVRNSPELELISRRINSDGRNISFDLLYKASVDGGDAKSFHEKCDHAKSSVVLVETTTGKRFGGYTSLSWAGDCIDKSDENAFIFSLDKMLTYGVKSGEPAIGCYPDFGPVFMGCQIRIYDDAFTNGGTTFEKDLNYNTTENYELNGGKREFQVKDIEVYGVTFG